MMIWPEKGVTKRCEGWTLRCALITCFVVDRQAALPLHYRQRSYNVTAGSPETRSPNGPASSRSVHIPSQNDPVDWCISGTDRRCAGPVAAAKWDLYFR